MMGTVVFETGGWGIDADVPFKRVEAFSPTFGRGALFFQEEQHTQLLPHGFQQNIHARGRGMACMETAPYYRIFLENP